MTREPPSKKATILVIGLLVLAALAVALLWKGANSRSFPGRVHRDKGTKMHARRPPRMRGRKGNHNTKSFGAHRGPGMNKGPKKSFQPPARRKRAPRPPRKRAPGEYDIVLVVIDTLRADATTPHGSKEDTTPFLKELVDQGIIFTKVFSPGPWTVPSMYSMMTGLYPSEHGICDGVAVGPAIKKKMVGQQVLPDEAVTLAESLKRAGYTTFGVSTNFHLARQFGFAQGFDDFQGGEFSFIPFPNMAVESLGEDFRAAPKSFLWLHFFDPHYPYLQVEPWFTEWNKSRFKNYLDMSIEATTMFYRKKARLGPNDPLDPKHLYSIYKLAVYLANQSEVLFYGLPAARKYVKDEHIEFFRASYASNVRQTDEAVREAFETLGISDQSLVIVTSDHGEELFHHGGTGHRRHVSVYQELIHVPLIIRLPGRKSAGTVIDTPVSLIDIYPTLLDLLGEPVPEELSGVSLKPLMEGGTIPPRTLYSETKNKRGEARTIIEYPWKYIYNYKKKTKELYNLEKDPGEKNNLEMQMKERVKEMHKRLINWVDKTKPQWPIMEPAPLSPRDIKKLKKMGYLN
ncbi:MAG: sulfatase-like hydrolase/transferase [Deltaproteobacteria bacterium]|nr:sulfatase-like hydrolase/transferase [Deltaproteobacteria bacterium]